MAKGKAREVPQFERLCKEFIEQHGPILTVGPEWFQYRGIYEPMDRRQKEPAVIELLAPSEREPGMVFNVLNYVEQHCQVPRDRLWGACGQDEAGNTLLAVRNGVLRIDAEGKVRLLENDPGWRFTARIETDYDPAA